MRQKGSTGMNPPSKGTFASFGARVRRRGKEREKKKKNESPNRTIRERKKVASRILGRPSSKKGMPRRDDARKPVIPSGHRPRKKERQMGRKVTTTRSPRAPKGGRGGWGKNGESKGGGTMTK